MLHYPLCPVMCLVLTFIIRVTQYEFKQLSKIRIALVGDPPQLICHGLYKVLGD